MRTTQRSVAVLAAAVILLLAGGGMAAWAAWSSTGSGSGSAASTKDAASTISPAAVPVTNLYPGAVSPMNVSIDNPNPYPVIVTGVSAGTAPEVSGCPAATVTSAARADLTGLAPVSGTKVIPANESRTFELSASMIAGAADACKEKTFSLSLTATLLSAAA